MGASQKFGRLFILPESRTSTIVADWIVKVKVVMSDPSAWGATRVDLMCGIFIALTCQAKGP